MAKHVSSKRCSGLGVTRHDEKWKCTWKKPSDVVAQEFEYKVNDKGRDHWRKVGISKGATSKTIAVNDNNYYDFSFRVRCKQKSTKKRTYRWSPWRVYKITIRKGPAPSLSVEQDSEQDNVSKFSWKYTHKDDKTRPFLRIEYQTATVAGSAARPKRWGGTVKTGRTESSVTFTEDTDSLAKGSFTRWVRIRSLTRRGYSEWRYASFTYARPNASIALSAAYDGGRLTARWSVSASAAYPVDSMGVKIARAVPTADGGCPEDASWTDIRAYRFSRSNASSSLVYGIPSDSKPAQDEALFVRIDLTKGHDTTAGVPVIASGAYRLKAPSIKSTTVDADTDTVTIAFSGETAADATTQFAYRGGDAQNWIETADMAAKASAGTVSFRVDGYDASKAYEFRARNIFAPVSGVTMESAYATSGSSSLPSVPTGFTAIAAATSGTVETGWTWADGMGGIELSWSDHADAWDSTDAPSTYNVPATHRPLFFVSGLDTGKKWYFRARFWRGASEDRTFSGYTELAAVDLSAAPTTPSLVITPGTITVGGKAHATWAYASGDGTAQAFAEICECTVTADGISYGAVIASSNTAQSIELDAAALGWAAGTTHQLAVRVMSASGHFSDGWSTPVPLNVADVLACGISTTAFATHTAKVDADDASATAETFEYQALTALPLAATVTGGISATLSIVRDGAYHVERPDGSELDGFDGETIAVVGGLSDEEMTIDIPQLVGRLDDGAWYELVATCTDAYGQTATASQRFRVEWAHQPVIPSPTAEMVDGVAQIIAPKPDGAADTDTISIYRLSTDLPQLIVDGGAYGTTYVDPFPAFGEDAGYRIVSVSRYDDYIDASDVLAWADVDIDSPSRAVVIDFGDGRVELPYGLSVDSSWEKRFARTDMLGGSEVGDWSPGIPRDVSIDATVSRELQPGAVKAMRELAEWPGICHVRTPDGSSFTANVDVEETDERPDTVSYSLTAKRVDGERLDGMTLAQWQEMQSEGE